MTLITESDLPAGSCTEADIINARRVWHRHRLCRYPNSGRCGWCRQPWIRERHGCPARYQAWRVLLAVAEFDAHGQLRMRSASVEGESDLSLPPADPTATQTCAHEADPAAPPGPAVVADPAVPWR